MGRDEPPRSREDSYGYGDSSGRPQPYRWLCHALARLCHANVLVPVWMDIAGKIRQKLKVGRLPASKPEKLYGGHGDRLPCSGCDQPIFPAQIQYEFDVRDQGTFRFHVGCLALWAGELMKWGWLKPPSRE